MEDHYSDQEGVIETLVQTFGQVISEDVICSIVGSFNGDLNESANAIVNMISDNQMQPSFNVDNPEINLEKSENNNEEIAISNSKQNLQKCSENKLQNISSNFRQEYNQCGGSNERFINQPSMSCSAGAPQIVIPSVQMRNPVNTKNRTDSVFWTNQVKQIFLHYNEGIRILIIMRGVPGSGKSYLARKIFEATVGGNTNAYKTHIFCADDYFTLNGYYRFDKLRLADVHALNLKNAVTAMTKGVSPVIIDNTNIEIWEMEPYVREGVRNGYLIEVIEPNTPWAKNANQLMRRNVHGVPIQSIRRMLENFQNGVNPAYLIKYFRLSYPGNMIPPVLRNIPVIPTQTELVQLSNNVITVTKDAPKNKVSVKNQNLLLNVPDTGGKGTLNENDNCKSNISLDAEGRGNESSFQMKNQQNTEIENKLEEFAKVEAEWDNGENWEDNESKTQPNLMKEGVLNDLIQISKPQREVKNLAESKSNIQNVLLECQDWTQITTFMPPWDGDVKGRTGTPPRHVQKVDCGTCIEIGDTDIYNINKATKILSAVPRDINLNHIPFLEKKVPEMRMLDKSSMTNEQVLTESFRCKNEEKHFKSFRKMFKNLSKADLRDVFDSCCGDVNWAVSIVLDGMANKELSAENTEELSEDEEESQDNSEEKQCECLAAYNIIPDQRINPTQSVEIAQKVDNTSKNIIPTPKKIRKENIVSENSINIKRQIEKNVVISDTHYSERCLKLRKLRRGEQPESQDNTCDTSSAMDNSHNFEKVPPSTSKDNSEINLIINSDENEEHSDDGEASFDYVENTVNIDLGRHFISQLDEYFGRNNMIYPESVKPVINIPVSLLNEINALWMESLMDQLEKESKQTEVMMKQDEEIARQLALKEMELAKAGKEPEVPDFKEIMDMEYALSLYQKDVAEWRNNEPKDLAAKLTRDKLYDLFPAISKDVLCELLMAHDNNFLTTVEALLMSTGNTKVLEQENGLNSFIMTNEMERQEKQLQEQKKALSEVEWPLLPKAVKVDMEEVEKYRREADMHLAKRNLTFQKARECVQRGMTNVASYYSEVAAMHARGYEKACCLAAASLIQVHSANNPDNSTIDLHFLRVREARESVDLFLDAHIKQLQEIQQTSNVKSQTLYFITGRGLHSGGVARIKPAVKKRLRERGIAFKERNPGLLTVKVNADDKMTNEVV